MRATKIISTAAALVTVGVLAAACGKNTATTTTTTVQEIAVKRGNVTVQITATGNLAYSDIQKLAFDADGSVSVVNVEVGDTFKKDDVLASLDREAWQDQIDSLQTALTKAQRAVPQKELALQQAQLNLLSAQDSLNALQDILEAQKAVDNAQYQLDLDQKMYQQAMLSGDAAANGLYFVQYWSDRIKEDKQKLADAKATLADVSSGTSTNVSSNTNLQIAQKKLAISQAEQSIVDAQNALADANQAVTDAKKALDEAKAANLDIRAPFDGVVTAVAINAGGGAKKGATAITVADTSKFQTDIMVNEMDIPSVSIGTEAEIQLESVSNVTLPGRVVTIAPVATNQSGVVSYKVTADLTSLAALQPSQAAATTDPEALAAAEQRLKDALARAVAAGTITQAQADQFKTRFGTLAANLTAEQLDQLIKSTAQRTAGAGFPAQGSTVTSGAGAFPGAGAFVERGVPATGSSGSLTQQERQQFLQSQSGTSSAVQLRQGMSVTVNLIVQQSRNVLVVPNNAVKTSGGKSTVQVKKADGAVEQKEVTIGLKDYQYTEIVSGLNEGDMVVIATTTNKTNTTSAQTTSGIRIGTGGLLR
jgi:HlyD family secretion protein